MNPSILVVEDDDSVRKSILRTLSARGFDASGARDAEEALRLALAQAPSLIIMDLQLPLVPGNEAVRQLQEHSHLKHIPVIALSATPEDAAATLFAAVLTKPCATDALIEAINQALQTRDDGV